MSNSGKVLAVYYQFTVMLNEAKTSRPRPISGGWGHGWCQK